VELLRRHERGRDPRTPGPERHRRPADLAVQGQQVLPRSRFDRAQLRQGRGLRRSLQPARRLGKLERNALADLDLDEDADGPTIRARYIELVKRTHPDSNGGDRSAEHKLQRVIKAYQALKKAKMA